MALKDIFNAMKHEGFVLKDLDMYLLSLNDEDQDRATDVNSPSQVGNCLRARYYARTGDERNPNSIDARTRRVFDNGTHMHMRIQGYLKKSGKLILDELPVVNDEYQIQGHTDGLIKVTPIEVAILELKSINSKGFSDLKDAKPEHKKQGLIYLYLSLIHI